MTAPERRHRGAHTPDDVYMNCRLCWKRIKLDPERVEVSNWQIVYRCQLCDSTFLIRTDDAIALGVQPPTS